jgi:hypothetical protein
MPRPRIDTLDERQAAMQLRFASSDSAEYHVGSLHQVAECGGKPLGKMRQAVQYLLDNDLEPTSYQVAAIFGIALSTARTSRSIAVRLKRRGKTADDLI